MTDYEHDYTNALILASVTAKTTSTDGDDERISSFVGATRAILAEMKKVDPNLCMDHLYKPGVKSSEPARIPVNQTDFGSFVKVSAWGDRNPCSKQKQDDRNDKQKRKELEV